MSPRREVMALRITDAQITRIFSLAGQIKNHDAFLASVASELAQFNRPAENVVDSVLRRVVKAYDPALALRI